MRDLVSFTWDYKLQNAITTSCQQTHWPETVQNVWCHLVDFTFPLRNLVWKFKSIYQYFVYWDRFNCQSYPSNTTLTQSDNSRERLKMPSLYFLSPRMTWTFLSVCLQVFVFLLQEYELRLFCGRLLLCCFPLSSVLCLSTLWGLSPVKGNLLTGLVAFLCLCCSHSVSRQLSLCGFRKKGKPGKMRRGINKFLNK